MSTPAERPVALAVIAVLEAEVGPGRVGYGGRPPQGGWPGGTPGPLDQFRGYTVVFAGLSTASGPATGIDADAIHGFQVTAVGASAEQADALRDRARAALLTGIPPAIAGRACGPIAYSDGIPVTRDDDVTPPLWYAADRYTLPTTPA